MKKFLSILLALLMILSLAACGGGDDKGGDGGGKNDKEGVYTLGDYVLEYKGATIAPDDDSYPSVVITIGFTNNSNSSAACGFYISSKAEQNGEFMYPAALGNDYYSKQAEPGETIDIVTGYNLNAVDYQGNRNYTDKIKVTFTNTDTDESCTITIDPTSLDEGDGVDRTDTEVGGGFNGSLSWLNHWTGDWYGWWIMTDPTGEYAQYGEGVWDACAYIEAYEDMTGYMELWDSEGSRDSLIAGIDLGFANPDDTEFGVMSCEGGQFLSYMLASGEWIVDPSGYAYDNILDFRGEYSDEYGTFSYRVVLRPWGTVWDDLSEEFYPDLYYDWYLPLIDADKPMPDYIG